MTEGVIAAHPQETLVEIAVRMRDHAVGAVAIMEGDELKGIVTERDLTRATADGLSPRATVAEAYMTPAPLTITAQETVEDAVSRMVERRIRHLPVIEDGRVIGVVSARDVLVDVEPGDLGQLAYEPW
jgi:CBS domain-containing protein